MFSNISVLDLCFILAINYFMKKAFLGYTNILCLLLLLFFWGCKKDPDPVPKPNPPVLHYEAFYAIQRPCFQSFSADSIQYIDSLLLFTNYSRWTAQPPDTIPTNPDTNHVKTYRWDFGDNSSSTDRHTSHRYTLPGTYKVSLVTFLNGVASDTAIRYVRILNGQREIKTSYTYTTCIDMEEAPNNCLILLLSSYNSSLDPPVYTLMKIDSIFKPIWTKPVPGNNIRLNSLKKIAGNEYILSGNFTSGNTDQFSITRITGDGDLIWTKYINNLSGTNVYTVPTSDGNLITIGDTSGTNPFNVIVKCTLNGDEIWRKSFNTGLNNSIRTADNIIETTNGYLFAATKPGGSYGKIVLTSLDINGNIIQQSETNAGNWGTIFSTGIVKNGNVYMVYPTNTLGVYFFTDNLAFSSSAQILLASGINHAVSYNGSFYIADGRHQYSQVVKYTATGSPVWTFGIKNELPLSCTSLWSGATRYCKKILCTANDVIALSYGANNPNAFSFAVYIEKAGQGDGLMR